MIVLVKAISKMSKIIFCMFRLCQSQRLKIVHVLVKISNTTKLNIYIGLQKKIFTPHPHLQAPVPPRQIA